MQRVRGKAPHAAQIKAMRGKSRQDPRYRPAASSETMKQRRERAMAKALREGRSFGYSKK